MIKKLWYKLPYPITHFYECANTAPEWHALLIGFCYPAIKIWGADFITRYKVDTKENKFTDEIKNEPWYFVSGILLSTIAMVVSAVLIVKVFI